MTTNTADGHRHTLLAHRPAMLNTSALNRVLVAAAVVALLWLAVAWALSV